MYKKIILLYVLLFITAAFAQNEKQLIPEFKGGLKINQIEDCLHRHKKLCEQKTKPSATALETSSLQISCLNKQLATDKTCYQAKKLQEMIAGATLLNMQEYNDLVTVFNIVFNADGIEVFYMVDKAGHVIQLSTNIALSSYQTYRSLKQKYPDIMLTTFLYWTKINEDLFPKAVVLPNKNLLLIFKQELRNGECVACEKVGIAQIAYEFDQQGIYIGSKLLKISAL